VSEFASVDDRVTKAIDQVNIQEFQQNDNGTNTVEGAGIRVADKRRKASQTLSW